MGRHRLQHRSSKINDYYYKFEWPFKSDYSYSISGNKYKEDSHDIEIKRTPMILEYHIRISGHEYNKINLLSFI